MPEIKQFPETRVAFIEERGPFDQVIPRGYERLFAWLREQKIQPTGNSMAVFYDDPAKVAAENQRVDTCVPVDPIVKASGSIRIKTIGGGEVATIVYQGRHSRDQGYTDVYRWLKVQGYRDIGAPIETFQSQLGEELRAEIAVPVEKEKRGKRKASAINRERGAVAKRPARRTKSKGTNPE